MNNPQSLNKYQYTYNNPVNMVDPDGHCPPCFGPSISGVGDSIEFFTNPSRALDKLQLKISVIGMAPVDGDAAEITNVVVSGIRGNFTEALIDAGAVATGPVGSAVAVSNRFRKIAKIAKAASKIDDTVEVGADVSTGISKQTRLREIGQDQKASSADRGWIKQETNQIERGKRSNIRVPPGKELAHEGAANAPTDSVTGTRISKTRSCIGLNTGMTTSVGRTKKGQYSKGPIESKRWRSR